MFSLNVTPTSYAVIRQRSDNALWGVMLVHGVYAAQCLEVGQGVSAGGALDSQTVTSAHRQTRASSPSLSQQQTRYFLYLLLLTVARRWQAHAWRGAQILLHNTRGCAAPPCVRAARPPPPAANRRAAPTTTAGDLYPHYHITYTRHIEEVHFL